MELLESTPEGPVRWRETGRDGTITYEVDAAEPPRRLVIRIADPKLPFGGTWTYVLEPDGGGVC